LGALLRGYKEFEERVGTIERGRGAKGDRVQSEILKQQTPFSICRLRGMPWDQSNMVLVILRAMKAEGQIEPTGVERAAKWQHTQYEQLTSSQTPTNSGSANGRHLR
jgi:hypothetical protein